MAKRNERTDPSKSDERGPHDERLRRNPDPRSWAFDAPGAGSGAGAGYAAGSFGGVAAGGAGKPDAPPGFVEGGTRSVPQWTPFQWEGRRNDAGDQTMDRLVAGTGPSQSPTAASRGRREQRGPRWTPSDDWILDKVADRLTRHPDVDPSEVEVRVENGQVVLEGTVPDRRTKHAIEEVAAGVRGVVDVLNLVRVRPR